MNVVHFNFELPNVLIAKKSVKFIANDADSAI